MLAFASTLSLGLIGCGGDDASDMPDAGAAKCEKVGGEACFKSPTAVVIKDNGMPANLNCTAPTITASTQDIELSGTAFDFQNSDDPIPMPTIEAFDGLNFASPVAMTTGAVDGTYKLTIPTGKAKTRMNFRTKATGWLDTYALNINVDVTKPMITNFERRGVSLNTADALPAFIGVTRTAGLGVLAGVAQDCSGDQIEHAIATVSTSSAKAAGAKPTFVQGAQVYYFSNGDPNLPVRRNSRTDTNKDGLFVIIEIPPTSGSNTYFLQVWAYLNEADKAADKLTLISELESPVVGDSVISVDMTPNVK
jgi:hypothetical protein